MKSVIFFSNINHTKQLQGLDSKEKKKLSPACGHAVGPLYYWCQNNITITHSLLVAYKSVEFSNFKYHPFLYLCPLNQVCTHFPHCPLHRLPPVSLQLALHVAFHFLPLLSLSDTLLSLYYFSFRPPICQSPFPLPPFHHLYSNNHLSHARLCPFSTSLFQISPPPHPLQSV